MVCPHRQGGGGLSHAVRICCRRGEGGQFFSILCGILLWTVPYHNHIDFMV